MDGNDKVRIGVIGAGGRGRLARYVVTDNLGGVITALCDIDPEGFKSYADVCAPDVFTCADYRDLLARKDVDAVFVSTPDNFHEEHAIAALKAGKDVYLEKPMAITIPGCDRILRTAAKSGRKLYLGHNMRHMAFVQKLKQLVDEGAIGQVKAAWCRHFIAYGGDAYFKDWHADRTLSTGLLLQKAAHDIDVLHWICGGYTKRVVAQGALAVYGDVQDRHAPSDLGDPTFRMENWPPLSQKQLNPVIDVEDLSHVLMALDNGVLASYQQCHYTPDAWRNYTIIGTHGRIENMGDEPGNCIVRVWTNRTSFKEHADEEHSIPAIEGSHGGADPAIVEEFVRWLREGGRIATSAVAARYSVAAGCAATSSLRNGSVPEDVPPLPREIADYFSN